MMKIMVALSASKYGEDEIIFCGIFVIVGLISYHMTERIKPRTFWSLATSLHAALLPITMTERIKPRTLKGFRDYPPAAMIPREWIIETARRCGIRSHLSPVPSLALGTEEVTPLELAAAYGTFAQQGSYIAPQVVNMITDQEGELLEGREPERRWALSSEAAFLVTDILQGVFSRGTAKSAAALGYRDDTHPDYGGAQ